MTKKKATKAEAVVSVHPDVVETSEDVKKAKSDKIRMTEFERWEVRERERQQKEMAGHMLDPVSRAIVERRKKQAEALWSMYHDGKLIRQTIQIGTEGGVFQQEVLFSHKSKFAI